MPNPNVLASYEDEVLYWKQQLRYGIHSKATKEFILAQLRDAAKKAGIEVPAYNSSEFPDFLAKGTER